MPEAPSLSMYRTIDALPLSRFIDCIVDGNLFALVITGIPDIKELQTAWNNILQEYSDSIGTGEYRLFVSLYKEVSLLELDLSTIYTLVNSMRTIQEYIVQNDFNVVDDFYIFQSKMGEDLNYILKTTCKFNCKDDATFQEELNKCIRRSASIKIRLDLKLLAFDAIQKKNKGNSVKLDRKYFDSMLITISDHAKYEIGENITVSKYCERIKRYNQHCENLKAKK